MTSRILNITDAPYNAACDNATDDTAAVLAAVADLTAIGGGKLIIPGPTRVSQTINIAAAIFLEGIGYGISALNGKQDGDFNVLHFAPNIEAWAEKLAVYGSDSLAAVHNVVVVETNAQVHLRDFRAWGGYCALYDLGTDGDRDNCDFSGWNPAGNGVTCVGANWWRRCKIDQAGPVGQANGFLQGSPGPSVPGGVLENHFDMCDFSGRFGASFAVDDAGRGQAVMVLDGCVFSSPVNVANAKWVAILGAELGANISVSGSVPITVADSFAAGSPVTVGGSNRRLANNFGVT